MTDLTLHHVSIVVRDVERSIAFYQSLFNLERLQRPDFPMAGAWFACGTSLQLHLISHAQMGTFRRGPTIDPADTHFAFRTDDFDGFVAKARSMGFRDDAPDGDRMRLLVRAHSKAGFPQVYLLDPDDNLIEVNGAK
jgi:catechol 2,3-dioxygenase-like lactoylglutathione lyase family enzyme